MAQKLHSRREADSDSWMHKPIGPVFATLLTLAIAGSFTNYLDFLSDRQKLSTLSDKVDKLEKKNDELVKTVIALRIKMATIHN